MTTKPTISIGIPAYNEEQNIKNLLEALLSQRHDSLVLEKIIVVSDGSTDGTVEQVRSVPDDRVQLIALDDNEGIGLAQNRILEHAASDVLVLLDADVLPVGESFLEAIVAPFAEDSSLGLVSANRVAARPISRLESFVAYGNELRTKIFLHINGGDNVFLCFGAARAFRRDFYEGLRWPDMASEDAYSYLKCHEQGYSFRFLRHACVLIRSPLTFRDHAKQSNRYYSGRRALLDSYRSHLQRDQYVISSLPVMKVLIPSFLAHPIKTAGYMTLTAAARVHRVLRPTHSRQFETATSTKQVTL